jgi:cystathionine beta-lyase
LQYDFDQQIDRTDTHSVKWSGLESIFGVQDAIPMWVADMDFKSPQPVIDALTQRVAHGIFGYTMRPDSYLQAIIDWQQSRHNFTVEKDWLCHSPGVVTALSTITSTFTEPGDKIIIQPPVYYPFRLTIERNGREVITNPLKFEAGHYVMDYDDLEEKAAAGAKLIILSNPHNPVGRVWSRSELERLGQICRKHDVLIVSDEIHGDLIYNGYTYTPFASISEDFAQHSIVCVAASKTFNLAGFQTSTIIIPNPQIREQYMQTLTAHFIGHMNVLSIVASESAYRYGGEWLDQLLTYLQANVDFLTTYLAQHIPQIKVIQPEGTYLVWLDCRELGLDRDSLDELTLKQAGIALDPGHFFGPEGEGFNRINIGCPRAILEQACKNLKTAVQNLAITSSETVA